MATGKRQHKALTIVKAPGPSMINFLVAIINNESLTEVKLQLMQPEGTELKPQATIQLKNAAVVSYNVESHEETDFAGGGTAGGTSTAGGGSEQTAHEVRLERIELSFSEITVTWTKGGLTAHDDWQAQA
jgi:type VI secretion system Hcp family effector